MKTRTSLIIIALGFLLISTGLTFGERFSGIIASDMVSGALLILIGWLSLKSSRVWLAWAAGIIGVWLQMAPLLFWAKEPAIYLADTVIGAIVIVLSFYFKESLENEENQPIPSGWSYNPSGWNHMLPTVALAMLCWFFSRYMAAYQLGYITAIWDPFFKEGTLHVITSQISKDFPVSDAGLGAVCYTLEALLGWQGSSWRWKKMPWLVFAFGFLVIPVGIVSVTLIILQPVVVGAWCSWCLATAACMLLMILLTGGELAAVLQLLWEVRENGGSIWQAFWKGVTSKATSGNRNQKVEGMGIGFPWTLVASAAIGVWLMFSPALFQMGSSLAKCNYIFGPMIIAFSVIACAEVFRSLRFINLILGLILVSAPWFADNSPILPTLNTAICGVLVFGFGFCKGKISQKYGAWNRLIF